MPYYSRTDLCRLMAEQYDTKSNVKWMTIYSLSQGLSTQEKELTAATRVMQSSSYELSPLVSGKAKCK